MRTIKIHSEEYKVLFNANAIMEFTELSGLSLDRLVIIQGGVPSLSLYQARLLIWCGIREAAQELGEPFTLSVRDVGKWMDPLPKGMENINPFLEYFMESYADPDGLPEVEMGGKKQTAQT